MKRQTKKEKDAIAELRSLLRPGDRVYVHCTHVARSGMSRDLRLQIVNSRREIQGITPLVARATGHQLVENKHGEWTLRIGGCGMDMGFAVVHDLGRALFPNGGPLSKSPRAAQEKRHGRRKETDGGYLLKHEWI